MKLTSGLAGRSLGMLLLGLWLILTGLLPLLNMKLSSTVGRAWHRRGYTDLAQTLIIPRL